MRKVAACLLLVLLTTLSLFTANPAWALECQQETLYYDNWESEKLFAEADLFAAKTHLAWGTEACPIDTNKRWLTTWVQVLLEDGTTGWLDDDDLVTLSDFQDSVRIRHADGMSRLKALLAEIDRMEHVMQALMIDTSGQYLDTVLLSRVGATLQPEETTPAQTPVPSPTLQPAVDTPSQPNTITYIIRSGDSLRQIAEAHNTSIDEILKLNPEITNANQVYVGKVILLPSERARTTIPPTNTPVPQVPPASTPSQPNTITYIIRSGDSLRQIAEAHNTSIDEILKLNPEITNPNQVYVGSTILLPGEGSRKMVSPTSTPVPQAPPTSTPTPQAPAVPSATGNPYRNMLAQLPVGNRSHHNTYDRDEWDHWVDDDRDCENARAEVLIAESRRSVTYRANGCTVDTGLWVGPWGGRTFTQASQVDIDHHVPLYNVHISGGHAWNRNRKRAYANDLALASALQATENGVNRAKGAGAPDEWKPPVQASWCRYAQDWIEVKHKYSLLVTQAEKSALSSMLDTCTGQPYVPAAQPVAPAQPTPIPQAQPTPVPPAQPTPIPQVQPTPVPPTDTPQSNFPPPRRQGRYCNDFDTRAQYEAFYAGRAKPASHDRDRDGLYCEALN